MRLRNKIINREMVSYIVVGALTTVVSLGVYFGITEVWGLNNIIGVQVANAVSWLLSVFFSFVCNKWIVFQRGDGFFWSECLKFYMARLTTLFLEAGMLVAFVLLAGIDDKIVKLLSQAVNIIVNYVLSKYVVFKR